MLIKKCKDKKRKLYHFNDLVNDFDYYDFARYNIVENNYKYTGYIYALEKSNREKLKNIYEKYENTLILYGCCQYAPEIKKSYLFIAD